MIDFNRLKNWESREILQTYTARDAMLYALSLGVVTEPAGGSWLEFVYEKGLKVLPSFAATLASPGMWTRDHPELGIDYVQMVHGEQRMTFQAAMQPQATVQAKTKILRVVDKGIGRGALVVVERSIVDQTRGSPIATNEYTLFCRGDGGFSTPQRPGDLPGPALANLPSEPSDLAIHWQTRLDTALLYRLCGDFNPLHSDPLVAKAAGFELPILHGLAVYGIACAALIQNYCDGEPLRMSSLSARFSSPTYPGEKLLVEFWKRGDLVHFRVMSADRHVAVLNNGSATLRS